MAGEPATVNVDMSDHDMESPRATIQELDNTEVSIFGYRKSFLRSVVCWMGYLITGFLLRLVFHWLPQYHMACCFRPCSLNKAEKILIKDQYGQYSVHSVYLVTQDGIELQFKKPTGGFNFWDTERAHRANDGFNERTPLRNSVSNHFTNQESGLIRYFYYKKLKYIWSCDKRKFQLLHGIDNGMACSDFHTAKPLSHGDVNKRRVLFSENSIDVPITPILTLLFTEAFNPFYIFQMFSCALWFSDEYYIYASCIVVISVGSLVWELYEMRANQRTLRDTVCSTGTVLVCRDGQEYQEMDSSDVVPGDILEIPRNGCTMFCDAVLISGNCIVNESMLTGESVPVTKTPLPNIGPPDDQQLANSKVKFANSPGSAESESHLFGIKSHSRHVLFCGTRVIQTRYYEGEHVRALVIRTGFLTAKGDLVRSILFPKPTEFKFNRDAMRFIIALSLFAICGFAYTVYILIRHGEGVGTIIIRALDLVTIVVPPALPVAMTVGIVFAQRRLKKNDIFCISPNAINVGGVINVVCFDKTGTLTEDGLDLWGVIPSDGGHFDAAQPEPCKLGRSPLLEAMATCHSLTRIDGMLSGDPLDLKMFLAIHWEFIEEGSDDYSKFEMAVPTIVRPVEPDLIPRHSLNVDGLDKNVPYEIGIIRQFPFSSSLQRMSVIARVLTADHFNLYLKGSPEMVETLCRPDTIPHDFHDVLLSYTREGYRVLALAWRPLKVSYVKALRIQRGQLEMNLQFLGLLVMENRLKEETTPIINIIKSANIRTVMVTGDNMLTALSVARDCEMIDEYDRVILVTAQPPLIKPNGSQEEESVGEPLVEFHYAEDLQKPVTEVAYSRLKKRTGTNGMISDNHPEESSRLSIRMIDSSEFHLAMSGKTWSVIRQYSPELIPKLVVKGTVFARFSPDQKQQLIESLQSVGYHVAMCGDGANDCGALKAAHTGVSLSEAEASVASPFTSKRQNISCVPELIKEGRCALATSFGTFKFMAGYSLTQFVSVLILYWIGANLTDYQFLYVDMFLLTSLSISFGYTKAYDRLCVDRPSARLISTVTILSITVQMLINIVFQAGAFIFIRKQPWFIPFDTRKISEHDYECQENTAVFFMSSFQYIILAIVFSKAAPFRRSIFSNYFFIVNIIITLGVTIYILLYPAEWLRKLMEIVRFPDIATNAIYGGAAAGNFFIAYILESLIDGMAFRRNVRKLKKIFFPRYFRHKDYERIREEIQRSTPSWPPIIRSASVQDMRAIFSEVHANGTILRSSSVDVALMNPSGDDDQDESGITESI